MSCRDYRSLLSAFHDGELGRSEAEEVREHLVRCLDCRRAASELRTLSRLLASVDAAPPAPAGFADAVMGRLRAGEGIAEVRAERVARWSALAAAAVALMSVAYVAAPRSWTRTSSGVLEAAPSKAVDEEIRRNDAAANARHFAEDAARKRAPAK
jgi:anti-sigma factor RsiW